MKSVENRITASKLIKRALDIADVSHSDFLSYDELIDYLNIAWKTVYQNIINYNLNYFVVEARLVGAAGVYNLPFDCYQIKSVRNPITGREIPRRADSETALGGYYDIVNNTLRLGPVCGPVTITYWRKPYFLSFPNKTRTTQYDGSAVLDVCKDSILQNTETGWKITNLLTDNSIEVESDVLPTYLGINFVLSEVDNEPHQLYVYSLNGQLIGTEDIPDYYVKSDDGMIYLGYIDGDEVKFKAPATDYYLDEKVYYDETLPPEDIICVDNHFYSVEDRAFPIGIFDDRPAYIKGKTLCLINPDGSIIREANVIPTAGVPIATQYGYLTFDGKLISNIPDTLMDFPNNLFVDVIAYDLAARFLAKQNADSSGVTAQSKAAWQLLRNSIDQASDFARIKLVR